jgi:hypothetical protein
MGIDTKNMSTNRNGGSCCKLGSGLGFGLGLGLEGGMTAWSKSCSESSGLEEDCW